MLILLLLSRSVFSQNPHGDALKLDCAACHLSDSWSIPPSFWDNNPQSPQKPPKNAEIPAPTEKKLFHHDDTGFSLQGGHAKTDCRACHNTLVFSEAQPDCISCHTDIHRSTVGNDCSRCHTANSWLVDNVAELHLENGFPLVGAHATANCNACHISDSGLEFNRIGNACINCHGNDFAATTNPKHTEAGFSTDCLDCHKADALDWSAEEIEHDFFPLTKGHEINDCASCHIGGAFSMTPTNCFACHQSDFETAANPNHLAANFSNDCAACHTTDLGWAPAVFDHDAEYFPIYSGAHEGVWNQCSECHTNSSNYAEYSCVVCHLNPETDEVHPDVGGYVYENTACLACHPTGDAELVFDHNQSAFPLTGAHQGVNCLECHAAGFEGTSTECASCHTTDFNQAANPNHVALGLSTDCASCHTTAPGWAPATFAVHNDYYPLNGAHAAIANDCATCHNGDYTNTPNTCAGCHLTDFNQTTAPDHQAAQFPTDCASCHGESAWTPSTFNHDNFYPLTGGHAAIADDCAACHHGDYTNTPTTCAGCHTQDFNQTANPNHVALGLSTDCVSCHTTAPGWAPASFAVHNDYYPLNGAHAAIANDCATCHNGDYNNTPNTCMGCHAQDYTNTTNPDHEAAQFPTDCESCHSESTWVPSTFNHDNFYPLTGGHAAIADDCAACHHGDYTNTPTTCAGCHTEDFNQTANPNHVALGLSTDCVSCHTTAPGWAPATFDNHDDFYPLYGAHTDIANDCASCHQGDYTNTPNTCFGCHEQDYNGTTNPDHNAAQFPITCENCHRESAWTPALFDHDAQYFPIYSGDHAGVWSQCSECHTNASNYAEYTCTSCHINPETDEVHNGVGGYIYENTACLACHPMGDADVVFDHNQTQFPLTGAHQMVNCLDCHAAGFQGTSTECASCHTTDFNQTANPNHVALGLSTDCVSCHTTAPGWAPASFAVHNDYYPLNGAHAAIANDCASCHNGDYNNTPNTCAGCHLTDFNQTTAPDHEAAQFPTDCASCHGESTWVPSTFNHDNFYPLTGGHAAIADDCAACHHGDYTNTPTTCAGCHTQDFNQTANPNHVALGLSTDCVSCHTTAPGWAPASFAVHNDYYPLNGAHAAVANDCASCHNGDYNNTPNTCAGCHLTDYNNTTDPNHLAAQFSTNCQTCHSESVWTPATFDHDAQYFPIYSGAHEGEWSQCVDCHTNPANFAEFSCTTCHANPETDQDHEGVGAYVYESTACLACHPTGDGDVVFDHNQTQFPLTGAHQGINCLDCHAAGFQGTSTACVSCHTTDFNQTANPNHLALGMSTDCASCHTTQSGWAPASFIDHNDYYALNGAHGAIANDCASCHNGDYNNTPNTCVGCHLTDFNQTTAPDHEAAQFPTDCASCHGESAWVPSTFNHDNFYPLTGGHAAIADDCAACHHGDYTNTPTTCAGCHTQDFNQTANPNHVALGLSTDCVSCHTTAPGWAPASFAVHNDYYPLNGAHAAIANDCATCHNGDYNNTPNTCAGCHLTDFNQTTAPDHEAAQFPTDCASCHGESAWAPATFNHDDFYPLTGGHALVANDCAACHHGDYTNTPTTCAGCHTQDFNQTANPNHVALGLSTDCVSCHTTAPGWAPASFGVHNDYYPLNGAHAGIANDCATCHNGDYNNTPNTCMGCHAQDYNNTTNPDHEAAQFPTDCESCHSESAWIPSSFNHDNVYPLVGAHALIANDCAACHNGDFNNTPNTCFGCHTQDYNTTTNPNHQAAQFPTDCASCHSESSWVPSSFNHDDIYPLTGGHALIANECAACHSGGFTNTPNTCAGCHTQDFNQTANPNHVSLSFSSDCVSCHTTAPGWAPASFPNHNDYYALNGAHAAIANDCAACHNGDYNNTPNTCAGCHIADYNNTNDPDHQAAQFSTNCESCHSEDAWIPSSFDHDNIYPLVGAHAAIANNCVACHIGGNYANTPNTCFGCHSQDYNGANNPNHLSAGFPTNCESCHSQTNWSPSTFNHDGMYFPIYSGNHNNEWDNCVECHTTPGNFSMFSCIECHEHDNPADLADDHDGVNGYIYQSSACYACHPDGQD